MRDAYVRIGVSVFPICNKKSLRSFVVFSMSCKIKVVTGGTQRDFTPAGIFPIYAVLQILNVPDSCFR
jgi:hypothetical protein